MASARWSARCPTSSRSARAGCSGIAVDPLFIHDSFVYAYLTTATDNRIVRFRLEPDGPGIYDLEVILDGIAAAANHDGGALAFGPDGMLYAGVGDAGNPDNAQDPDSLNGKILRMDPLGNPPIEDPNPDPDSLVWSMGHRNVQGLAWDDDGRLWATEFGQNAFDEVNLIEPGGNYGWPVVEGEGGDSRFIEPAGHLDHRRGQPVGRRDPRRRPVRRGVARPATVAGPALGRRGGRAGGAAAGRLRPAAQRRSPDLTGCSGSPPATATAAGSSTTTTTGCCG